MLQPATPTRRTRRLFPALWLVFLGRFGNIRAATFFHNLIALLRHLPFLTPFAQWFLYRFSRCAFWLHTAIMSRRLHHCRVNELKEQSTTEVVRAGVERACKEFTERVTPLGFRRTKKMFWTRRQPLTVDFIHFHRHGSTYGAPRNFSVDIRVHFGVRVLNDTFAGAALNGPYSDATRQRAGRYHLRFNAKSGDTHDRCLNDLVRFVVEQGEPWFHQFHLADNLLRLPDSPLKPPEKQFLAEAIAGNTNPENEANSLKLLGIKRA